MALIVELTMRRRRPRASERSLLDGVRILAALPGEWHKDLRRANGDIVIRVRAEDEENARIRSLASQALADSELDEWEIVACDPVAGEHVLEDDR